MIRDWPEVLHHNNKKKVFRQAGLHHVDDVCKLMDIAFSRFFPPYPTLFGVGVSSVTIHVYDLGWKYQDFSTTSVGLVTKKGSRCGLAS